VAGPLPGKIRGLLFLRGDVGVWENHGDGGKDEGDGWWANRFFFRFFDKTVASLVRPLDGWRLSECRTIIYVGNGWLNTEFFFLPDKAQAMEMELKSLDAGGKTGQHPSDWVTRHISKNSVPNPPNPVSSWFAGDGP